MAKVIYARRALDDLDRVEDFLAEEGPEVIAAALAAILEAIGLLARHPLIGRPVAHGMRELVISRRRTGYLALYDFDEARDVVRVLAIRHQREAGYAEGNG